MTKERELLRRTLEVWDDDLILEDALALMKDIRTYLSAEPEAEPVAWMFQHEDTGLIDYVDTQQVEWGFEKNNPRWQKFGPVFLHPPKPAEPAREPMSEEELQNEANFIDPYLSARAAFKRGFRDAEKHHGIGRDDPETGFGMTSKPHEWQGLDEDEIEEILEGFPMGTYSEQAFAQAIEQALKEKNT